MERRGLRLRLPMRASTTNHDALRVAIINDVELKRKRGMQGEEFKSLSKCNSVMYVHSKLPIFIKKMNMIPPRHPFALSWVSYRTKKQKTKEK